MKTHYRFAAVLAFCAALAWPLRAQVNVTTWQCDLQHSGNNSNETILNVANVSASGSFGLLFSQNMDGQTYGQVLYAGGVNVGGTAHNIVFACTEHDSMYAFDADSNVGGDSQPLWHDSFLPTGTEPVPQADVGSGDISIELGITTTPVIDLSTSTIYIVSKVKTTVPRTDNTGTYAADTYQQYLHALDLATGVEKFGGPVLINPTFAGVANYHYGSTYTWPALQNTYEQTGTASNTVTGVVPFNPLQMHTRAAMTEYNGIVYISYASHSDTQAYHGEILGYNASTLQLTRWFISTPNGAQGGIWGGGAGPCVDSNGNMYVTTANGSWDQATNAYTSATDWSESFLKLPTTGTGLFTASFSNPATFFTPNNWSSLNGSDWDIGSSGVCLLPAQAGPHPHIMVGGGKGQVLYVVDRDTPGGYNATTDPAIQEISELNGAWLFDTPSYFNGNIYYAAAGNPLEERAVGYNSSTGSYVATTPVTSPSTDTYPVKGSNAFITSSGTTNGIVWLVNGSLRAYDATNIAQGPIFSYSMPVSTTKFEVPTVANGKAYVTGFDSSNVGHLYFFGQLPQYTTAPTAPTSLAAQTTSPSSINLTWSNTSTNTSGIIVERSPTSTGTFTQIATLGNVTSYTDTGLSANTTYYYEVIATNNAGHSGVSNVASGHTFSTFSAPGIVAYWNFDENGGTTANDVTGNGHNGSIVGEVDWATGIINSCLSLHGTGHAQSSVVVPNSAALQFTATQSFTISAWANVAALRGSDEAVIAKSADQGNEYGIYINAAGNWVFRGPNGDLVGPAAVVDQWTHVAGVQDGTQGIRTLYVNGVAVATGPAQDGSGAGDLWLGQQNQLLTAPASFPGMIDEIRVYNVPLPAAQIANLMGPPIYSAVSSITQGSAGTFALQLQPTSATVIEPREGATVGTYNIICTFSAPVSGITGSLMLQNGGAAVGTVHSISYDSTNTIVTVTLTGVADVQALDLHLSGIQPGNGTADIPFNVLWGDVNGDGQVTAVDASLDTTNAGAALSSTTMLYDVNCDGVINSSDVSVINADVNTFLGVPTTTNLALLQPASGSSYQTGTPGYPYANGNDGSTSTRWAANGNTYPQYWQVNLGQSDTLQQMVIDWYGSSPRAYDYNVQVSPDGSTFNTVINRPNNTTNGMTTDSFPANTTGQYVRINVTGSNGGDASAYEFIVDGLPGAGGAPAITTQPQAQTVNAGQSVTFSVAVSNTVPVTYQWQKNGVNIYDATGSTYTLPITSTDYDGSYSVVITDAYGTTTSSSVTLTVNGATVPATDTPTMPFWALALLGVSLLAVGRHLLPGNREAL